jgi:hypothetical protein
MVRLSAEDEGLWRNSLLQLHSELDANMEARSPYYLREIPQESIITGNHLPLGIT